MVDRVQFGAAAPHDLAIVIVAMDRRWLRPCLSTVFEHAGNGIALDVVVVDNESTDGTDEFVATEFPAARVVRTVNRGFGHANNRAVMNVSARYVLFLNPDTEILEGTFADLVRRMDERPRLGLVGVRQVDAHGRLDPTIRYFPTPLRALGEALGGDRFARRPRWLGERELDRSAYDRETLCDWTAGSFMLARREALLSAGLFDERFFMYSEETDLCRRIRTAGWDIAHLADMTILHHGGPVGTNARLESLSAAARMLYARKHLSAPRRLLYGASVGVRYLLRSVYAGSGPEASQRRQAARRVLSTLAGREPVPFAERTAPVALLAPDTAIEDATLAASRRAGMGHR